MFDPLSARMMNGENCPVPPSTVESSHLNSKSRCCARVELNSSEAILTSMEYDWSGSISFAPCKFFERFRETLARKFRWSAGEEKKASKHSTQWNQDEFLSLKG